MKRSLIENEESCPVIHLTNVLGGKWKMMLIVVINDKKIRFGKLHHIVSCVSKKVLTDQLRELEHDGLVRREKFAETPPRVEYSLTEKGLTLIPILNQMIKWTMENMNHLSYQTCEIVEPNEAISKVNALKYS